MTSNDEDILIQLSDDEVTELADLYSTHKNEIPNVHSILQTFIKMKEINIKNCVSIFSPRNCWREDGTFFALLNSFGEDIFLHSLDKTGKNLFEGMLKTNRFHFRPDPVRDYTLLPGVHEHFAQRILEILTQKSKHTRIVTHKTNLWYLEKNEAEKLEIMSSQQMYVRELESTDIPSIVSKWPDSQNYSADVGKLGLSIKLWKGFGVYLTANKELVSYILMFDSSVGGQVKIVETDEEFINNGSMLVTAMAKYLAEEGFGTCATVKEGVISEKFFKKLNFKILYKCVHFEVDTGN
ncbi:hypothetical protein ABEB36_003960 [Hypothenemus hampei]|uniref:DUF5645 domain-containing protein n=1 Tax=Hypothenemus hampei TaxID=57062 RepID=A0ABD1F1U0_HYPHA